MYRYLHHVANDLQRQNFIPLLFELRLPTTDTYMMFNLKKKQCRIDAGSGLRRAGISGRLDDNFMISVSGGLHVFG